MTSVRGCCLILSCTKPAYEKDRFTNWDRSICHLAKRMPVFYLFGSSEVAPRIPIDRNVHKFIVPCGDDYEDIPMKIYYGFRSLGLFQFDYILKLDETIGIHNVPRFCEVVEEEVAAHPYIALDGVRFSKPDKDRIHMIYYHSGKCKNSVLNTLPALKYHIPFCTGPGYIMRKNAYKQVEKAYFQTNLYEDYAMGYNMYACGVPASTCVHGPSLLYDNARPRSSIINDFDVYNSSSQREYDAYIATKKLPLKLCNVVVGEGLGKQLFQLAAALEYCIKYDMNMRICAYARVVRPYYWDSLLRNFNDIIQFYRRPDVFKLEATTTFVMDKAMKYTPLATAEGDVTLYGDFHSSQYCPSVKSMLRSILYFAPDTLERLQKKYGTVWTTQHVVVHARRAIAKPLDEHYYQRALAEIKTRVDTPVFVLISDNMPFWSMCSIFSGEKCVRFDESDIDTLFLMTQSSNFVIANSAFSWWGAVLADAKHVIAPSVWEDEGGVRKDILEPSWICI